MKSYLGDLTLCVVGLVVGLGVWSGKITILRVGAGALGVLVVVRLVVVIFLVVVARVVVVAEAVVAFSVVMDFSVESDASGVVASDRDVVGVVVTDGNAVTIFSGAFVVVTGITTTVLGAGLVTRSVTGSVSLLHFGYWPDHLCDPKHCNELKPCRTYPSSHSKSQVSSNLFPVHLATPFSSLTSAGHVILTHFGISDSQKATFP